MPRYPFLSLGDLWCFWIFLHPPFPWWMSCVAGQHEPVIHQQADVLGGVARRVHDPDVAVADLNHLIVGEGRAGIANLRPWSQMERDARLIGQLAGAGQMIGVKMCFQYRADPHPLIFNLLDVGGGIALRVNDRTAAPGRAADQVRRAGFLFVQYLSEVHGLDDPSLQKAMSNERLAMSRVASQSEPGQPIAVICCGHSSTPSSRRYVSQPCADRTASASSA